MKNSRGAATAKSMPSASQVIAPASVAAVALDTSLISIKIVNTRPEEDARLHDKAHTLKRALQSHHHGSPPSLSQSPQTQQSSSTALRFLIALAPNTIFACVSGALGLAGACAVALLALVVLLVACVVQFFQGMALMLVETDRALLQFTTGTVSAPSRPLRQLTVRAKQQPKKKTDTNMDNAGSDLVQTARSLLSLSCELLAIGFFKGTIGLSYYCSLYGALAIPFLLWTAGGSTTTALYSHSFEQTPVAFALLHGGLWAFALLWLGVTGSMSQFCSQNLRTLRR